MTYQSSGAFRRALEDRLRRQSHELGLPLVRLRKMVTFERFVARLAVAGINPITALCYPVTQHIAEKLHAYTRPHTSGESSRVKDLVDILLIARASAVDGRVLCRAIQATFEARGTHALPDHLPGAPASWNAPFSRMASDVGLRDVTLAVAMDMAGKFLDPVLQGHAEGLWDAALWKWR